jgi:phosphatidylserine/phosphatidylglycerophosphate/cardiolipin synthase-like enzyme
VNVFHRSPTMLKNSIFLLTLSILLTLQPTYAANSKTTPLVKVQPAQPVSVPTSQIQVYFSPNGGCTEAVVNALNQAKKTLLVQAYSFTSAPIAKAVVDAHKRGVQVQVILDKSQRTEKYSSADFVAHAGIKTLIDSKHKIAHNKIMVIDSNTVITGSFNFTKAAEEGNAENLLIISSPELAKKYTENWKRHEEHGEEYAGR